MEELTDKFMELGSAYGIKLLAAVAIFVIGRIVIGMITGFIKRVMNRAGTDEILTRFIVNIIKTALLVVLVIMALNQLGVETTSLVAVLAAAGLAIGFALQGSLSNFASGILLIIFRPFKSGDFIEAGGKTGVVEEIGIFSSTLRVFDNTKIIIPNSGITGTTIINYSSRESRRVDLVFGIGYDDDLKRAKNILERALTEDPRVLKDPAPLVAVSELADSSVNFVVRPWVKDADYWGFYWDITEKVKLALDAEGISIPYPQRDIHMKQSQAA